MAQALSAIQLTPCFTEPELVAAVRQGDDRAFEELFSRYRSRIGSYIHGMVGDHARAEDIAQDVFISALRRLRDTQHPVTFKPWIYEIAKNACIDEFRRNRRAREVSLESDDDGAPAEPRLHARNDVPDVVMESKQRLADLRGAFSGLSESHHRILVLRELEGLSYDQIGAKMGMSRPVVESTLFRARRRLNEEYQELVSGRRCEQVCAVIDAGEARSVRSLGVRGRRQLARHLAHCQGCRRHARFAGVDEALFKAPSLPAKIAALLPLPWLRWRRGGGKDEALGGSGPYSLRAMQSLQKAAPWLDPASPSVGLGRVAAAAAALAIVAAGGGFVEGVTQHHSRTVPRHPVVAPGMRSTVNVPALPPSHRPAHRARVRTGAGGGGGGGGGRAAASTPSHSAPARGGGASGAPAPSQTGATGPSHTSSTAGGSATGTSPTSHVSTGSSGTGGGKLPVPSVPGVSNVLGGGGSSGHSGGSSPNLAGAGSTAQSLTQGTLQSLTQSTVQAAGQAVNDVNNLSNSVGLGK